MTYCRPAGEVVSQKRKPKVRLAAAGGVILFKSVGKFQAQVFSLRRKLFSSKRKSSPVFARGRVYIENDRFA
jgi:hypothetical protein